MVGQALAKGEIVHAASDAPSTICDALQPPATKPINLAVLKGRADPGVTASDEEVRAAQRFAFSRLRLVVEPGGAAALAAALASKVPLDTHTVIMLRGGHVDPAQYAQTIARSEENTSALQPLMRISYAVFCLKQKKKHQNKQM